MLESQHGVSVLANLIAAVTAATAGIYDLWHTKTCLESTGEGSLLTERLPWLL